jgi:hypothetical protein
MCTFILKSYSQKVEIKTPHFFILNKGNNSGKPLLSPCPNCFVIQFENVDDKECVYWILWGLWQSKAFYPFLRGSVIPFIVLRDVKSCIEDGLDRVARNPEQFNKAIDMLQKLSNIENQYIQNLKIIKQAKTSVFRIV